MYASPSKNNDCYFYYYSSCSKGPDCPFRHEPAALANETVCYYWKAGNCSRPHCSFRHLEVNPAQVKKKTSVVGVSGIGMPSFCYWEQQPTGCQKVQCPYIHRLARKSAAAAMPAAVVSPSPMPLSSSFGLDSGSSIIVNKRRLESLQHLLPVVDLAAATTAATAEDIPRRLVVPPGSGVLARRVVTGGIKNRLGGGHSGQIKQRLGERPTASEEREDQENRRQREVELGEEEARLRDKAIKTLDLRNRIENKIGGGQELRRIVRNRSEESVLEEKVTKRREEKETRKVIKIRKKKKKEIKQKTILAGADAVLRGSSRKLPSIQLRDELPSASDYSDLDTPAGSPDPGLLSAATATMVKGSSLPLATMRADTVVASRRVKSRLGHAKQVDESARVVTEVSRKAPRPRSYASRVLGDLIGGKEPRLKHGRLGSLQKTPDESAFEAGDRLVLPKGERRPAVDQQRPEPKIARSTSSASSADWIPSMDESQLSKSNRPDDHSVTKDAESNLEERSPDGRSPRGVASAECPAEDVPEAITITPSPPAHANRAETESPQQQQLVGEEQSHKKSRKRRKKHKKEERKREERASRHAHKRKRKSCEGGGDDSSGGEEGFAPEDSKQLRDQRSSPPAGGMEEKEKADQDKKRNRKKRKKEERDEEEDDIVKQMDDLINS